MVGEREPDRDRERRRVAELTDEVEPDRDRDCLCCRRGCKLNADRDEVFRPCRSWLGAVKTGADNTEWSGDDWSLSPRSRCTTGD